MSTSSNFTPPKYLEFCLNKYQIDGEIGEGTFSCVYRATCKATGAHVAIKAITKTSSPNRILEELLILKTLAGEKNCIRLNEVIRSNDQILAVFPLVPYTDFKEIILKSTIQDIKYYIFSLLVAVEHIHNNNIIHRDLKPGNFLFDLESQWGYLIDFGLAHFEIAAKQPPAPPATPVIFFNSIVKLSKPPGYFQDDTRPAMKAPRSGTRGFRAPEVLFKVANQSKAIDMWSVGVIMLSILSSQYPFFMSIEDIDGLVELGMIFGHATMRKVAKYYGRVWKSNLPTIGEEGFTFEALLSKLNPQLEISKEGIDLLTCLLDPIDSTRITAKDALNHPFFANLRRS